MIAPQLTANVTDFLTTGTKQFSMGLLGVGHEEIAPFGNEEFWEQKQDDESHRDKIMTGWMPVDYEAGAADSNWNW